MSRPALLAISTDSGIGGQTRSLLSLLEFVGQRVHRVVATAAGSRFADLLEAERAVDTLVHLPPTRRLRSATRIWSAAVVLRTAFSYRGSLRAIHANGLSDLLLAVPACLTTSVPCVVWFHGSEISSPHAARLALRAHKLIRVRWVAVSEVARDALAEALRLDPGQILVVPNPIDQAPDFIRPPASPSGRPTACFLGGATAVKGFDYLPRVISSTADALQWRLFTKRSERTRPGMSEAWRWMVDHPADVQVFEPTPDLSDVYSKCDVVFVPSNNESFCRVAAESMARGIPVVASDIPAIRTLFGESGGVRLFRSGNMAEASDALLQLAGDSLLRDSMGERGRRFAARFSPEEVLPPLMRLYGLAE